jgi:hypothetical protein
MHTRAHWLICAAVMFILCYALFRASGGLLPQSWSNALLPGFLLSAFLLVKDKSDFGSLYVAVGILFNTVIYTVATLLVVHAFNRVRMLIKR